MFHVKHPCRLLGSQCSVRRHGELTVGDFRGSAPIFTARVRGRSVSGQRVLSGLAHGHRGLGGWFAASESRVRTRGLPLTRPL